MSEIFLKLTLVTSSEMCDISIACITWTLLPSWVYTGILYILVSNSSSEPPTLVMTIFVGLAWRSNSSANFHVPWIIAHHYRRKHLLL